MRTLSFLPQRPGRPGRGFTLVEMLVVIGIIGILAAMLMPALARAKAKANSIKCLNHMRQIGLALTMYAEENRGEHPVRAIQPKAWPQKLKPFYMDYQVLVCPSDSFGLAGLLANTNYPKRSFIINAFNDYFAKNLSKADYERYQKWNWPHGMRETAILRPSETLVFGEKRKGSPHVHMDVEQGQKGNDFEEIDHARHGRGSNFVFADNSVRLLSKNQELYPENLWAVEDEYRYPPAPPK